MFTQIGNKLCRRAEDELLWIEPWGPDALRVRATPLRGFEDDTDISALLPLKENAEPIIRIDRKIASIQNGKIRCEINEVGLLQFFNQKGKLLLEEYYRDRSHRDLEQTKDLFNSALDIHPRKFEPNLGTDNFKLTVSFEAQPGERFYGMGQYQMPHLELKGCKLELAHRNSQASIPFTLSSRGYGFLWNNPAIGYASFGKNLTEWEAESTRKMDYWIVAGDTPAEIEEAYADAVGKVPMMPDCGTGFWQCKLRYLTQDEILSVAREYKKRQLPISVIVIDFFHWTAQGDWKFDPVYWPDPEEMVRELREMGIELMVSIWPTAEKASENYKEIAENGYLIHAESGRRGAYLGDVNIVDFTNPEARAYVWSKIKENYYDKGIKLFWLDEAEPEINPYAFRFFRYDRGNDLEIGNIYPKQYARMAYEGMEKAGQQNILNLVRCAWAGSQKYGTLIWSGDIDSSFRSLRDQFAAGLNMGIAGIPWWTTDIGGFHGGNIYDDKFRECLVRWFEYATFCPVMRMHGVREPMVKKESPYAVEGSMSRVLFSGADNEVWSYGEEVYDILKKYMFLRERMRPYLTDLMKEAHEKGDPVIRTMFYEFPEDPMAWETDDQFMLGSEVLVAPVLYENMREREVYLPEGFWKDLQTGESIQGGKRFTVSAPLDKIPVYIKEGCTYSISME